LYSKTFKDHIANPRNAGELPDANAVSEETNPVCGDRLRLMLRIRHQHIEAAAFLGLTPRTLEAWRQQKRGPKYLSYSLRCVRYRLRDLMEYQESTVRQASAAE